MTELKPCPFCGSPVKMMVRQRPEGNSTVIRCENIECYMAHPLGFTSWHNGDSEEHAELRLATAWNRRVENG